MIVAVAIVAPGSQIRVTEGAHLAHEIAFAVGDLPAASESPEEFQSDDKFGVGAFQCSRVCRNAAQCGAV